ncbi:MAG: ATP-binding protein [Myxococcota bacterium]
MEKHVPMGERPRIVGAIRMRLAAAGQRLRQGWALEAAPGRPTLVLHVVSLWVTVALVFIVAVNLLGDPAPTYRLGFAAALLAFIGLSQWILRRGHAAAAAHLFTVGLWAVIATSIFFSEGIRSPSSAALVSVVLVAGLVLGMGPAVAYAALNALLLIMAYLLEVHGLLPDARMTYGPLPSLMTVASTHLFIAVVLGIGLMQLRQALVRGAEKEAALRTSERKLAELIRESPLGIVLLAEDDTVQAFNPEAERVTGRPASDVLERNLFEALELPAGVADCWREALRKAREGQPVVSQEWSLPTVDGDPRVLEVSARSFSRDGISLVELTLQDVTEEVRRREHAKALEAQLRHRQRLEAIGLLAGGIAHDFNNLLTVVVATIALIRKRLPQETDLHSHLDEVAAAAERGTSLTRQLLAFGRRQMLQPRRLDLNRMVESGVQMLRRVIGEDIEIALDLHPEVPHIQADRGQIDQVVINLALNARDAMPQGGRLTLRTRPAELSSSDAELLGLPAGGHHAVLEVVDTGVGMDEATRSRMFDPFFTTKEPGKGTGLGLSTTIGIVEQSGGTVDVETEPGKGTLVRLYFPAAVGPAEPPRPRERTTGTRHETILLAEDDELVRRLAVRILRDAGYEVLEARDGRHALEVANAHPGEIHLLVTDAVMPGIRGNHLIDRLLVRRPAMRALIVSGYTGKAATEREGVPLLQKPFTPEALTAKVREVLEGPPPDRRNPP